MGRLVPLHRAKLVRILEGFGFTAEHGAKHFKMTRPGHPSFVTIPRHGTTDIGGKALNNILKEAGISREEYERRRLRL